MGSEGLLGGSEGLLEESEILPEGSEGLLEKYERYEGNADVWNFYPFYRTLSPVRAATQKDKSNPISRIILIENICSVP